MFKIYEVAKYQMNMTQDFTASDKMLHQICILCHKLILNCSQVTRVLLDQVVTKCLKDRCKLRCSAWYRVPMLYNSRTKMVV